jgi:hypothetical protein
LAAAHDKSDFMPKWNRLVRIASCAPSKQLVADDIASPRKQRCSDGYRAVIPLNTLSWDEQRACQKPHRDDSMASRSATWLRRT